MAQLERFKLQAIPWDSDKDPASFNIWVETMGSLVRSTAHGAILEEILDYKLRRKRVAAVATPSWILDDPDFGIGSSMAQQYGAQAESTGSISSVVPDAEQPQPSSTQSGASGTSGSFSLGECPIKYGDLSEEAKALDAQLSDYLLRCSLHALNS
jgi:hypothetical protein